MTDGRTAQATRPGSELDAIRWAVQDLAVEIPSWGFVNTGTRFRVFPQAGVPRNAFEKVEDAATSPNPLTNTFGGWQAVENAGLAIAESSRLLTIPGRVCSNGRAVPVARADWIKMTADLRKAGVAAYQAAKKKSTDAIVEVAGTVSDACQACHDKYREKKGGEKDRCLP